MDSANDSDLWWEAASALPRAERLVAAATDLCAQTRGRDTPAEQRAMALRSLLEARRLFRRCLQAQSALVVLRSEAALRRSQEVLHAAIRACARADQGQRAGGADEG